MDSPQTSMYYALQVQSGTLSKDDATSAIEDESYKDIFGFESEDETDDFCFSCAE